jgi:GT2 family glycosyltransferase
VFKTNYSNYEVIVVDDASTDGTSALLKEISSKRPNLTIIRNERNMGHAESVNIAVKHATGDFIAKLDEDTIVDKEWLRGLLDVMLSDPTIGASQSCGFHYWSRDLIPHYSAAFLDCLGRIQYKFTSMTCETFHPVVFSTVIPRQLYLEVGGFYPDFFAWYDESDLGWRIRLHGYRVLVVHRSIVRHMGAYRGMSEPGKNTKPNPFILYHAFKNQLSSLLINYELHNAVRFVPLAVSLLGAQALKDSVFRANIGTLKAFAKAIAWHLFNMRLTVNRRVWVNTRIRKVSDREIVRWMVRPRIPS